MTTVGATFFSWYLAYAMKFKITTFAFLTVSSAATTHYLLKRHYQNKMKNNVNNYASSIASNYPDIKYLKINYTTDKLA